MRAPKKVKLTRAQAARITKFECAIFKLFDRWEVAGKLGTKTRIIEDALVSAIHNLQKARADAGVR